MNDITNIIRHGYDLKRRSPDCFDVHVVLDLIRNHIVGSDIDWDEEAGEEWSIVFLKKKVIAHVCATLPIIVVLPEFSRSVLVKVMSLGYLKIDARDFSDECYAVNRSVLETAFGRTITSEIDTDRFSIETLRWATI